MCPLAIAIVCRHQRIAEVMIKSGAELEYVDDHVSNFLTLISICCLLNFCHISFHTVTPTHS